MYDLKPEIIRVPKGYRFRVSPPKKINATSLAGSLVYDGFPPCTTAICQAIERGKDLHQLYHFDNQEVFARKITIRNNIDKSEFLMTIEGKPDSVIQPTKRVIEFKTYSSKESRKKAIVMAKIQLSIYMWLTGYKQGGIVLYNTKEEREDPAEINVSYSSRLFRQILIHSLFVHSIEKANNRSKKEIRNHFSKVI